MVYENKIPIEVKKPFETVQELKNETPSFEEFMKTYESDGNLNYDDLKGGGVDEEKGYGPCRSSYCNDCSCPLSSCRCRTNEKFVKLWSVCPAVDCEVRGISTTPSHWIHSSDGEYTWMSNQARIRCQGCGVVDRMTKWRFRCSAHKGDKDPYRRVDPDSIDAALAWSLTVKKDNSTSQVVRELIRWILDGKEC
jgi:hypothetical protein